jgi:hypothetical protein
MLSQALKHNGSLYAHVYFARSGYPVDPTDPEYEHASAFGRTHRMDFSLIAWTVLYSDHVSLWNTNCVLPVAVVVFLRKSKAGKKKSLLGDSEESEKQVPPEVAIFILVQICELIICSIDYLQR